MLREEGGFYDRDPRDYRLKIALVYPAPYLAAINSLGHQILYFLLNSFDDVMAERFVTDLKGSVESGRSLDEFDLILATIHFEGQYPVLYRMLDGARKPVVVGGPAVSANPLPISSLVDAVGVGDGEVLIPSLVENSLAGGSIEELAGDGFFLPSIMNRAEFKRVRSLKPLENQIIVFRGNEPVNSYLVEISRGCGWGCRFCMLGWHWRPRLDPDPKDLEVAVERAHELGFKGIYVIGSDAASSKLIKDLLQWASEKGLRVTLPSLRADQVDRELIELAVSVGESMLTLAPETGSERMKAVVNKTIDNEEFVRVAEEAEDSGMRHLKLYFMVGLPSETDRDVEESGRLASRVGKFVNTKVTVSIFIPKAGTPFETVPLAREEDIRRRISIFRRSFRGQVNVMHYGRAYIQTFMSVGGLEIAKLLKRGARIPYNRGAYRSLANNMGIDLDSIVYGERDAPWWEYVDTGVSRDFLSEELRRAMEGLPTPGCDISCTGCMHKCWLPQKRRLGMSGSLYKFHNPF